MPFRNPGIKLTLQFNSKHRGKINKKASGLKVRISFSAGNTV